MCFIGVLSSNVSYADPLSWANGKWALDLKQVLANENSSQTTINETRAHQCNNNPEVVSVDMQRMTYRSAYENPKPEEWRPDDFITETGENFLKLKCDRNHPKADCNKWNWYVFFINSDRFVWIREDWIDKEGNLTNSTVARIRCPEIVS